MNNTCLGLLTALFLCAGTSAQAQDAVIRGTVTSDRGDLVPVADVLILELGITATTGNNGRYQLIVPGARVQGQQVTIRARQIGYKPFSRLFTLTPGEHQVDFTLVTDVNMLEAVVVTGVQEATERIKVPFAVTQVNAAQMPVPAANPLSQLQGKVPGANIVSASGRPGASPAVILRGPTSLNASGRSQEPLYIVDGVIINGSLPDLAPQDIESVEVIKGAAAASLYGARAGNGVIQITTKSGRRSADGIKFSVRSEVGSSDIERDFGLARYTALLMDETGTRFCQAVTGQPVCARTFDYQSEAARINNAPGDVALSAPGFPVDPGATLSGNVLRQRFQLNPWPGTTYNAVDQVITPHLYNESSVDVTGRFGGTRFFASSSNLVQQGAIRFLNGFDRQSFRLNVDQVIGDRWNLSLRSFYSRSLADGDDQEQGGRSFFRLTRVPAIVNVLQRDTLGRLYIRPNLQGGGSQNENPLYWLENRTQEDETNRFIGGMTLRYSPATWADFESNFSYDLRRGATIQFRDKGFRSTVQSAATTQGFLFRSELSRQALNTSVNATFRHEFNPDLRGRASLRYLYEQRETADQNGQGNLLRVKGVTSLENIDPTNVTVFSSRTEIRQVGLFAGTGLDYKDRYILDALVRRDGSSLFGGANRWATFGRVSLAWRMGLEPWWFLPDVTEFKVRGSYGTAGGSPRFSAQYETFAITASGLTLETAGNRNLRPELHKETEFGVDIEVLGRYGLTATYSRATIENQMLLVTPSVTTGFDNQWQNAGTLENKSWELSLNIPLIQRSEMSWSARFNWDRNRSVISQLDVPPYSYGAPLQATATIFEAREGERLGTFYGRAFVRSCSDLPAAYAADCGGPTSSFQPNDEGWIVWVGSGNNPGMGITNNLWETQLPGANAPWGVALNWGMPITIRNPECVAAPFSGCGAARLPLGNALPDFRFSVAQNFQWKRLTVYALLDASIGQDVWNQGFHWAHLDFLSEDVDQFGKSVETAKPIGYYYRAAPPDNSAGIGGFYSILEPSNFTVEDASYAKMRELLVSYHLGSLSGVGDWSVSVVGRNLFTITGYRGFDPEVGITGGEANSSAINAIDAFTFPNTRTFTIGVSTTF